jgi:hypothetical protein
MKTSILFWSFVMLVVFPAYLGAQEIKINQDTIMSPEVEIKGHKAIPDKLKEGLLKDFGEGHKPFAWFTKSTRFNDSEWQKNSNVAEVLTYALQVRASNGSILEAEYTPEGKLIKSREYLKNFKPELNIMQALQNTEYKDWVVKKTSQLKKTSSYGHEKERYALVMTKGKEKKTIFFDGNSRMIAVQPGEHRELADLDQ